jgi:hypothetical protein
MHFQILLIFSEQLTKQTNLFHFNDHSADSRAENLHAIFIQLFIQQTIFEITSFLWCDLGRSCDYQPAVKIAGVFVALSRLPTTRYVFGVSSPRERQLNSLLAFFAKNLFRFITSWAGTDYL